MTTSIKVLTDTPVFEWASPTNNCKSACLPRLMLWRWPVDFFSVRDRWEADAPLMMVPGTRSIVVSLNASHWIGVLGQSAADDPGFGNTLKHVGALCVTFGGGSFAGHGLNVSGGTAEFDLLGYELD